MTSKELFDILEILFVESLVVQLSHFAGPGHSWAYKPLYNVRLNKDSPYTGLLSQDTTHVISHLKVLLDDCILTLLLF